MKKFSKFLSLILRHNPAAGNITLDGEGWASVKDVLGSLSYKYGTVTRATLNEIVETNDKQRFAFNDRGDKIRANQGHSLPIDLKLAPAVPPAILYHGTKAKVLGLILRDGLKPQSRQHVHLSVDLETAIKVASRRAGGNVILEVHTQPDSVYFLSDNGVWLTDFVPPSCISVTSPPQ